MITLKEIRQRTPEKAPESIERGERVEGRPVALKREEKTAGSKTKRRGERLQDQQREKKRRRARDNIPERNKDRQKLKREQEKERRPAAIYDHKHI